MFLGPKITNVTKYGCKTTIRFPFFMWMINREFANDIKKMVADAWSDNNNIMTFRSASYSGAKYVMRVERSNSSLIKITWF